MKRAAPLILTGIALAIISSSFLAVFGRPVSLINLPLVLVVSAAGGLRFAPAIGAALVSGAVMDSLSVAPFGACTLAMIAVAFAASLLFAAVLTHLSFLSYLGANAGAFILFHFVIHAMNALGRIMEGGPLFVSGLEDAFAAVLFALPLQLAVCAAARLSMGRVFRRSADIMIPS